MARPLFRMSVELRVPDSKEQNTDPRTWNECRCTRTVARPNELTDEDSGSTIGSEQCLKIVETAADVASQIFRWNEIEFCSYDAAAFVSKFLRAIPEGETAWRETLRMISEDTEWSMEPAEESA